MTARARVLAIVAVAAAAVVAAVVGVTLLQTRGEHSTQPGAQKGKPPLELDFGLRADPEARALARAAALYNARRYAQAAAVFRRYDSLEAQIGAAFAVWPEHGLDTLKRLVASHPSSPLAELHLGLAFYWSGRDAEAIAAWKRTESLGPDTPYALSAGSLLHPEMVPLPLPVFVPSSPQPRGTVSDLARLARTHDVAAKLYYGVALQQLGHAVSAEREFAAAAALAPNDPEALAAAAVGRFRKDHPERAFSVLGPLARRFPHAAVVRFHLGYLLIWIGARRQAANELRLAVADGSGTVYSKEGNVLLASLERNGTK
jgi:tetratricopeptide (TPR) repeat protein